jgi:hypothetical protein
MKNNQFYYLFFLGYIYYIQRLLRRLPTGSVAYPQEKDMPQVMDAPEVVREERWPWDEEQTALQSSMPEPQRKRTSVYAGLRSAMKSLINHHPRPQPDVTYTTQRFELPIDRVAREHPFLFIKAMSG